MGPRNRSCIHRASGPIEIEVPKRHDCTGSERNSRGRHHFKFIMYEGDQYYYRVSRKRREVVEAREEVRRLGRRLPFRMRTPSKK